MRDLELQAADGIHLAARLFETADAPAGAVLIVPAMGVPQSFYEAFATWLAGQGFCSLTFDYRGMGASRRGSLAGLDADIHTWAVLDTAAALEALVAHAGEVPLTWFGHSLGGQIVGLIAHHTRASRIVTVACGNGYWRMNPPDVGRKALVLWYALVPIVTALCGYFPGRRLRLIGDLPKGVTLQWRRWCLDADYLVGAEGPEVRACFESVRQPVTAFSFADDELMTEQGIVALHRWYSKAPVERRHITPSDVGLARIGHFGFFRPEMEKPLWEPLVTSLLAR